jgi:hypothetical protein
VLYSFKLSLKILEREEELQKQYHGLAFDLDKNAIQKGSIIILSLAIVAMFIILNTITTSVFQSQTVYAQNDNWYVGKGLEPNTYYTYEIRELDTNQGRPFLMTIYFEEFDISNNFWIAPVFVVDQGRVFNGTFHLSDLDLSALGSSQVPPEMQEYRNAYSNSLQWLASFVPKPGQSLSAPNWGKIAAIGGSAISPSGSSEVTVPAGTFDTTIVSWHYGEDNRIWINPNMPYPVKAETHAAVTTGNPPIQYAYELQATGQGQPPLPKSEFQAPEPPLTVRTPRGTYHIQLIWSPPIISGTPEEFGLIFMDNRQSIQDRVTYGFTVSPSNGTVITELENQRAAEGTSIQTVTFPEPERYTIEINVESVAGQPLGIFVESARFTVLVE